MKTLWVVLVGFASIDPTFAAPNSTALHFPEARIGVPPLLLSESIANGTTTNKPLQFESRLPSDSANGQSVELSPQLIPRTTPNVLRREGPRSRSEPRTSRSSGMPIIEPSEAVDYKLTIIPPDPNIDYKLVIKDPTPAPRQQRVK